MPRQGPRLSIASIPLFRGLYQRQSARRPFAGGGGSPVHFAPQIRPMARTPIGPAPANAPSLADMSREAATLYQRGDVQRELGRFAEAVSSYDHALALRPDYLNALNGRAIALVALERFDEALTSYDKALALNPNFIMARYNRGLALARAKRLEEAIVDFDRVLALDPRFLQGHVDRGNALARLGRTDDALVAYER